MASRRSGRFVFAGPLGILALLTALPGSAAADGPSPVPVAPTPPAPAPAPPPPPAVASFPEEGRVRRTDGSEVYFYRTNFVAPDELIAGTDKDPANLTDLSDDDPAETGEQPALAAS